MNNNQNELSTNIYVNTRPKQWSKKEITYEEVIILAFETFERNDRIAYTVAWTLKNENQSGTMVLGDSIKVKKDMRFNVKRTDKS